MALVLLVCLSAPAALLPAAEKPVSPLEFRGQVIVPPNTLSPRSRIVVTLFGVTAPFRARTWTDFKGRFRFRKLQPATYTLSIYIPRTGEILQTVEITRSFADRKGRVEKTFAFDAEALRARARPERAGTVSVRELSIPYKAQREYEKAQSRLRSRDAAGATEHLKKAVEAAPQFLEALNNLG
ncbi:MAG: carboxypeptidase regulatory-like domain-containing protein, partial [Acidobacteria bacterium]|nr:carboxypeptidase regulatory-like domain-containing protein [Acidobacteriota bacterium]